jgi:hypothetical protein
MGFAAHFAVGARLERGCRLVAFADERRHRGARWFITQFTSRPSTVSEQRQHMGTMNDLDHNGGQVRQCAK